MKQAVALSFLVVALASMATCATLEKLVESNSKTTCLPNFDKPCLLSSQCCDGFCYLDTTTKLGTHCAPKGCKPTNPWSFVGCSTDEECCTGNCRDAGIWRLCA